MTLSAAIRAALFAQSTGEALLTLLEISHKDFDEPLRAVNNTEDVWMDGDRYFASAFELPPPDDTEDGPPEVTLRICNVDQAITTAAAEITSPLTVRMWIVAASDPDDIAIGPIQFEMDSETHNALVIDVPLTFEPVLGMKFPAHEYTPDLFPGLF